MCQCAAAPLVRHVAAFDLDSAFVRFQPFCCLTLSVLMESDYRLIVFQGLFSAPPSFFLCLTFSEPNTLRLHCLNLGPVPSFLSHRVTDLGSLCTKLSHTADHGVCKR